MVEESQIQSRVQQTNHEYILYLDPDRLTWYLPPAGQHTNHRSAPPQLPPAQTPASCSLEAPTINILVLQAVGSGSPVRVGRHRQVNTDEL